MSISHDNVDMLSARLRVIFFGKEEELLKLKDEIENNMESATPSENERLTEILNDVNFFLEYLKNKDKELSVKHYAWRDKKAQEKRTSFRKVE